METVDFLSYLKQRVNHYKTTYDLSDGQAFLVWYAVESLDLDPEEACTAVSYDGGNDQSIDMFYVDEGYERVVIVQGKYNVKGEYKGKPEELTSLIHTTDWLEDPEALRREGREDLAEASLDYLDAMERGFATEYHYVYVGPSNLRVNRAANVYNESQRKASPDRFCRVINLPLLVQAHEGHIGTRIKKEVLPLAPGRSFPTDGTYGKALVTTLKGSVLKHLYKSYGDPLFDRNVRGFLGVRQGSVNHGIKETLESSGDRKNFWAYNNGITLVCDHFLVSPDGSRVEVSNFSIVNGCQTTVSIANATKKAADEVEVLTRIISAPERTVDSIIQYTNSQNKIRPWDLRSQDPLQKRLKKEMANEPNPYLYVIRPGELKALKAADRSKFTRDSKVQLIKYDKCAQFLAAFKGYPAIAYKEKGRIFTTYRDKVYPKDIRVEEVILAWRVGQVVQELIRKELAETSNDDRDTQLILKRGAVLFVTALVGQLLISRNGANYLTAVAREVVTSRKTQERLQKYAEVALWWYIEVVKDLISASHWDLASLVRNQDHYPRIRDKVELKWKIQSKSKTWVKEALPAL